MSNSTVKYGKRLSYLLRHDKQGYIDKLIDENGWRRVEELIRDHGFTEAMIEEIVNTNDKKRYEFNEDKSKIRARQGHSIPVDVELKETVPPEFLYHGTCTRFVESILAEGLKPQTRLYVHLSPDVETALKVGSRHGDPVVFRVKSNKMHDDGHIFYLSNNGVWLTKVVPTDYLDDRQTVPGIN